MKKSDLKQIIKEEISKLLNEFIILDFTPEINRKEQFEGEKFLKRNFPQTAKTIKNATEEIQKWQGKSVGTHIWTSSIGKIDFYNTQHWTESSSTNITKVVIIDKTTKRDIGFAYVDTKIFGKEYDKGKIKILLSEESDADILKRIETKDNYHWKSAMTTPEDKRKFVYGKKPIGYILDKHTPLLGPEKEKTIKTPVYKFIWSKQFKKMWALIQVIGGYNWVLEDKKNIKEN